MQDILAESLKRLNRTRAQRTRMSAILLVLSLFVSLDVFWTLRQPGLTLAGDADCRITEHTHDELCQSEDTPCGLPEHVHSIECYCDETADVETQLDWQKMFADYPYTGNLREDLAGIAKTQVGYSESELNFEVDSSGARRGYTRYGAWYGDPYHDWSAMFVSFCLHYAGADPEEFPGNTGASSMAKLWKTLGKYADAGTYDPSPGDLVFFNDNTVGIVSEVKSASICVIRGDVDNAVCSDVIALKDPSISGWGLTEVPSEAPPEEPPSEATEPSTEETDPPTEATKPPTDATEPPAEADDPPPVIEEEDLLDISNGPAFFIIVGSEQQAQQKKFSLRSTRSIIDLLPYLEAKGGSYFFTLLDLNNMELPKDENGNYIAEANKDYKLTLTFNSPEGFLPGTYQYQIPNGLMVDGGEGIFKLKDGTTVGSWVVTDTGLITLEFNENMNNHSDITISSALGIHFPEQDEPIDFDGMISVKVEPPVQQQEPTVLSKWGSGNPDAGKINWSVRIDGYADSQIPGNILTDQVALSDWSRPHSYTESDIAAGLTFGVSDPAGGWHNWHVSADDPHLIWDENGWSYKIPKTVTCDYCGELELGSEGWIYIVNYSSTPTRLNTPGTFDYENKVTIDGQTAWGWSNFTHGEIAAEIIKDGSFVADASGGGFLWEIQAVIPGRAEGQRADYSWFIMDEMRLLNESGITIGHVQNDINLAMVLATYNGTTIRIPRIQDATDEDMFAWDNAWTATEDGISHTRNISLLTRCQCTPETCHWTGCGEYWFQRDDGTWAANGFCQCWTETQYMTFTLVYRTTDLSLIQGYGALGYQVSNHAQLFHIPDGNNSVRVSWDDATVPIPSLFEKQLTQDFNGYTANYKITINESKVALTDGTPLYIRDTMTKTLAFISGSLVITAEDANGNVTTLQQGTDYTVTYDGTGGQKDDKGNEVHVLDIVILQPQPVMYILDYDTTLIIPDQVTGAIKYSNSAEITLWGESIKDNATEKVYADINITSRSYQVKLHKISESSGTPLKGAEFGLYNEQGGLIAADVTDANGDITFRTNIIEGIILREHKLYYTQELNAPPGYQLDDTKHWFCFCDKSVNSCKSCQELIADTGAIRIPLEQAVTVQAVNQLMNYDLPATGGAGIYPLLLVSVMFIVAPLVYMSIQRRKQERRVI